MPGKLSDREIKSQLSKLSGWVIKDDCLIKEFKFADFTAAMEFINTLAAVAEELNHHPDWSNSYNKVLIKLTTHSEGGLSSKDLAFAKAAEKAA